MEYLFAYVKDLLDQISNNYCLNLFINFIIVYFILLNFNGKKMNNMYYWNICLVKNIFTFHKLVIVLVETAKFASVDLYVNWSGTYYIFIIYFKILIYI